jgi:Zn-dependent protease
MKWFRVPVPCSSDDPNTESTLPFVVDSLPAEIAAGFEPLTNELAALGFVDPVYHVINDDGTRTTIYWATFRHGSGSHFARIHNRVWQQAQNPNRALFPMFFSAFTDGTFLVSSSGKPDMAAPKTVQMNRLFRAPASRLWQRHLQLFENVSQRKLISPVRTREDLIELTERHHVLVRDFHLARGVFRPRTVDEQAQADSYANNVAQARASGLENAEVLAELQKLQEQKPGWSATFPILIISLFLFVVIGAARWNWQFTVLIIPVLLFHECGHWAAMRMFHYRNLRMFFIPLFGAAVTGHHWNVPGWKKALVFLAGPLPGIALGIFLGVAGIVWKITLLSKAALLLIFINGFNLLPVLPLDGGQVLHSILFCRNRWLDVVFRILAIGGLLLLGAGGFSRIFLYLAIITGITLPLAFKLARITDNLRKIALPEPEPGEDRIPVPTAQAIIAEVRSGFPGSISNKQIAQHTLNIFETLNAKPPAVFGTLGLLAVHAFAFLLVVVFGTMFTISKFGGLGDFAFASVHQPKHTYKCGNVQQWQGADAAQYSALPHNLLVAAFKKHDLAASEFNELTQQLPAASRLTLFGDSLLLSLPANNDAAREKWFDQLQTVTTNVFVAVSNQPVAINLQCIAPSAAAATNIMRDLKGYLANGPGMHMHLVAPWSPEYQLSSFEEKRRAREFWQSIDLAVSKAGEGPALEGCFKKIAMAEQRGAKLEVRRLVKDEQQLIEKLQSQAREQLRATATTAATSKLIDLNASLAKEENTNRVARAMLLRQVAALLGEVKYDGDIPNPDIDAAGAASGDVSKHGLIVEISWMQLNDATVGLPALARWLCDQNCAGVRYDLFAGFSGSDDDE